MARQAQTLIENTTLPVVFMADRVDRIRPEQLIEDGEELSQTCG